MVYLHVRMYMQACMCFKKETVFYVLLKENLYKSYLCIVMYFFMGKFCHIVLNYVHL